MNTTPITKYVCKNVLSRQKNDRHHGKTTSQAVIDFIQRTCPCEHCKKWRAAAAKPSALPLAKAGG